MWLVLRISDRPTPNLRALSIAARMPSAAGGRPRAQRRQHGDADLFQMGRGDPHPYSSTRPRVRKTGSSLLNSTLLIPPASTAAFCFSASTRLRLAASTL